MKRWVIVLAWVGLSSWSAGCTRTDQSRRATCDEGGCVPEAETASGGQPASATDDGGVQESSGGQVEGTGGDVDAVRDGGMADAEPCMTVRKNAYGQVIMREDGESCESTPLHCQRWEYDALGRLQTHLEFGGPCQGPGASCMVTEYDLNGDLKQMYRDDGCDGTRDGDCYGPSGVDVHGQWESADALDVECDSVPESGCMIVERDAQDRVTFFAKDLDCDGSPDKDTECRRFELSDDGLTVRMIFEFPCGGPVVADRVETRDAEGALRSLDLELPDECRHERFDALGRVIRQDTGATCDGKTLCTSYDYHTSGPASLVRGTDCQGTVVRCEQTFISPSGDALAGGDPLECASPLIDCPVLTHDAQGRLTDYTRGCDATTRQCFQWSYDDAGRVTKAEYSDCVHEATCETFDYDADGRQTFRAVGGPCSAPTDCTMLAHDSDGRLIEWRKGPCGAPTRCIARTFDQSGADAALIEYSNCTDPPALCVSVAPLDEDHAAIQEDEDCDGAPETCIFAERRDSPFAPEDTYLPEAWQRYADNPSCSGFLPQAQP